MQVAQKQAGGATPESGSLGTILRAARRRKRMTLQDLATLVGCAKSYLSQLETGFRAGAGVNGSLLARIEKELGLVQGELVFAAQWEATPGPVRRELARAEAGRRAAAEQLRELLSRGGWRSGGAGGAQVVEPSSSASLDELHRSGRLRALIDRIAGEEGGAELGAGLDTELGREGSAEARGAGGVGIARGLETIGIAVEVPLINSVAAGYPCDFTDLGYPARVADEYVRVPDVRDADAFAARVVGDSMMPEYREGDIVVFSPARDLKDGMDCFVRLEPDHESTFKRIFFEDAGIKGSRDQGIEAEAEEMCGEMIRLQPLNPKYAAMVVPRERVAGLYAAVSVTRMV